MNYKNLENKIGDEEILSAEDANVRALLGELKRVGTPADFDFRLKAKIARAKPNDYRPSSFLPVLRYVLPLALVISVSAFAVFNSVYFADERSVPQIAETQVQTPSAERNTPNKSNADEDAARTAENVPALPSDAETTAVSSPSKNREEIKQSPANSSFVAVESGKKPKAKIASDKNKNEDGGSLTSAFSRTNVIAPPGINPNRTVQTLPNVGDGKSLTVREVLSQLGIEAVFTSENWRVKSVASNSLAERSGVRAGDSVEAIDGEKLSDKPLKSKTIEGKNLTIARGAEKIEITLVNK